MQYMEFIAARADTGAALPLAKVTVYLAGTTTKATLFNLAGTSVANPVSADGNGEVGFAAANGAYDISIASSDGSYTVPTINKVQFYDLAELDGKVATVTAAATGAQTARDGAVAAAQSVSSALPVLGRDYELAERVPSITSNPGAKAVLTADGFYHYTNGFGAVTFDVVLTAAQIAAAMVVVDLHDPNGGTWTVEQRSASASVVAAAPMITIGDRRQLPVALDASTTILRITGSRANGTAGLFGPPAVTIGTPATPPLNADYLAALFGQITDYDGRKISFANKTGGIAGTQPTVVGSDGFSIPTGSISYIFYQITEKVDPSENLTVLIEISSASMAFRPITVTPLNGKGALGTSYKVTNRFDRVGRYVLTFPATLIGGAPVVGARVDFNTQTGGLDGGAGAADPITGIARFYRGSGVPKLRAVPTIISDADAALQNVTLSKATLATASAITTAQATLVNSEAIRKIVDQKIYWNALTQYYLAPEGADANAGTILLPKATIASTLPLLTAGRAMAFKAGEIFAIPAVASDQNYLSGGRSFVSYGDSPLPYVLDARQDMSGQTYTLYSGTTWKTTVTFPFPLLLGNGPTDLNSPNIALYVPDGSRFGQRLALQINNADQAANRAATAAGLGRWSIEKSGSTVQDFRSTAAGNGTVYDVYVNMPDGTDPTGKKLLIGTGRGFSFDGGTVQDVIIFGNGGKDACHARPQGLTSGPLPVLERFQTLDFPGHGIVGPADYRGFYKAIGRQPSPPYGSALGRAGGGALNTFTSVALPTYTVPMSGDFYLANATFGVQGHTSGTPGYKNFDASKATFHVANVASACKLDSNPTNLYTTAESLWGRWEIGSWTDPDTGITYTGGADQGFNFAHGGKHTVASGYMYTSPNPPSNANALAPFSGECVLEIRDFIYRCDSLGGAPNFISNELTGNFSQISTDVPTLILSGVQDVTPIVTTGAKTRYKGVIRQGSTSGHLYAQMNLYLKTWTRADGTVVPTVVGDLMSTAGGTYFPNKLFVDAGCTFGLGNRTGPEIDAALTAAGKVDGVDFSISGQTTIVAYDGSVLSWPGWK